MNSSLRSSPLSYFFQAGLFSLLLLLGSLTAQAQTRFVSTTGTNSNPASATSWATSTTNLQGAINASVSGDQVWVATGTYKPTTTANRTVSFAMKAGVEIYGGFAGTENLLTARPTINPPIDQPSSTTLSGEIGTVGTVTDNSYHVINNPEGLTSTAILDGFVITGGQADGGTTDQKTGAGMLNNGSGSGKVCSPTIRNCLFQSNATTSAAGGNGGGMRNNGSLGGNSNPTITNCAFLNNSAYVGGAINNDGGGSSGTASPVITNCLFQSNSAGFGGGAIFNNAFQGNASPTLTNCSFLINNSAINGGALFNDARPDATGISAPQLTNCSFQGNTASGQGGAIYTNNSGGAVLVLTNCVFFGNTVTSGSGSAPTATYSLFSQSPSVSGTGNINNVSVNPFVSTASVALVACSPAINAGDPATTSATVGTTDLAGNPRFFSNGRIDMGAVEFQGAGLSGPTWTGCVSRDWNTAGNWASGIVPTATDDAIIPSAPANQPIISTTATAKSVEVQSGASLSISSAGSLSINGSKNISGGTIAFFNSGTVNSNGQIIIGNLPAASVGQGGLVNVNGGVFRNLAGGSLTVDRTTGSAVANSGSFTNVAAITIGGSATVPGKGLFTNGAFQNSGNGIIRIDQTGGGIALENGSGGGSNFVNSATIAIGSSSTSAIGGTGIHNQGPFTNAAGGNISIDRSSNIGLLNFSSFVNSSSIIIGASAEVGQTGLDNQGSFSNVVGGSIQIDRAWGNSLWNVSGTFGNDGKIFIGSVANTAGILNSGTSSFSNNAGASIQLDRVPRGLTNRSTFFNAGQIRMGNNVPLGERGLLNVNEGGTVVFNNLAGALLQIDQTAAGQDGITNEVLTTFNNAGTVSIGTSGSIGGNGITNAGTVSNSACATLTVFDNINNSGGVTNAGFFTVSTTQSHTNTGTLTNNSVITYPQGNPIPNVTNNDLIVSSLSLCGTSSTTALQIGGSNSFSVGTTWFTTPALSTTGGTYNVATNTFTPNSLSVGAHTLYFTTTDNVNSCSQTVAVSLTVIALPTASLVTSGSINCTQTSVTLTASGGTSYTFANADGTLGTPGSASTLVVNAPGTYSVTVGNAGGCTSSTAITVAFTSTPTLLTWTGNTTTDWNTATNWCPATVPTATDDAVIPSGPANQPIISTTAVAFSVEVQAGASLSISSAGSLSINGSKTFSGNTRAFFNSGTVNSNGQIVIGSAPSVSVGQYGLRNEAIFRNLAGASLSVDRTTVNAVANVNGSFTNVAAITIGSSASVVGIGLFNNGAFLNSENGTIRIDQVTGTGSTGLDNGSGGASNFVNSASITIGATASVGFYGLSNQGSFSNEVGGSIQIDRAILIGIVNFATFNNASTVSIGTSGSIGGNAITNANAGTVTNQSCAVIRAFAPVYNQNGTFTNNGFLTVNTLRKPTETVVRVNSPTSLTGTYAFRTASFGPPIGTANITRNAVLVDDGTASPTQGCNALTNAALIAGNIALVDRGSCDFSLKVYNAQQAGATAVIVLNNTAGLLSMGTGINADLITIPSVLISQADGAAIKAALTPGPVNISITQEEAASSTTLVNNGVINYPQGNPMPNVTNNDLIVSSFSLCSGTSTTALQIGGSNSFSAGTTWYTNPALTTAGGTYDQGTNTFTPNSLSVGTHTLYFSATDNVSSCTQTVAVSVTVLALPTASLSASGTLTCAQTSVTLTASGGTSYTFAGPGLSQSGSSSIATASAGGTYTVTVGNANGCTSTTTATVFSSTALPTVTITPTPSLTISFQSVTLTASGADSYSWSSGASTTAISVSVAGPYTVTGITGGCAGTATVNVLSLTEVAGITVGAIGLPVDVNGGNVLANDLFIFTFVLTNTGNDPTRFQIPNMAATTGPGVVGGILPNDQTNTAPANGQLQFSTDNGTSWTNVGAGGTTTPSVSVNGTVQVRVPMTVQPGVQPNDVITLKLGNTTSDAQNVARSNDGGDVYIVDNVDGAVVGEILGSPTNGVREASFTQSVTVFSCTASLSASSTLTCAQTSVTLTAGGGTSYTFTNASGTLGTPGSASTLVVSAGGTYSVTVGNANGCTSATTTTVFSDTAVPTGVSLASSGTLTCAQPGVVLSASATGGTSYTLSNGQTSSAGSFTVSQAGGYTVTVANASGCTATATTTVRSDTALPTASLNASGTITCAQTSVTLMASGGTSYTFANASGTLGTPGSVSTLVVSTAGVYSVTVGNANGCTSTTTTTVLSNTALPTVSLGASNSLNCSVTSATLSATATGFGSLTYTFTGGSLTGSPSSNSTVVVNQAGSYSVLVTAANGCTASQSTSVATNTTAPTASLVASGTITCAQTSVTLTASGGTSYTFAGSGLSQSGSSSIATASVGGTYSVTVASANGCTSATTTTVFSDTAVPTGVSLASSGTLTCAQPSVVLSASATGGISFTLSNGQTSSTGSFTVSQAGGYTVTVVNASGCTATATTTVRSDTALPTASISATPSLTILGGQSATLSTGTNPVGTTYRWSTGATTTSLIVAPLQTIPYSLTVTSTNGCSAVGTATVSVSCGIATARAISAETVGGVGTANASVTASGIGTAFVLTGPQTSPPYSYVYSSVFRVGGSYAIVFPGLTLPGTYIVTAYYTNNCGQTSQESRPVVVR